MRARLRFPRKKQAGQAIGAAGNLRASHHPAGLANRAPCTPGLSYRRIGMSRWTGEIAQFLPAGSFAPRRGVTRRADRTQADPTL
ncbi:MAG: hypothetical protein AB1716_18030 [Planctomycetota bacterium]